MRTQIKYESFPKILFLLFPQKFNDLLNIKTANIEVFAQEFSNNLRNIGNKIS